MSLSAIFITKALPIETHIQKILKKLGNKRVKILSAVNQKYLFTSIHQIKN
jgi:hypothetical protein